MKRILFVGLCVLLSCSVALISINAADSISFNVSSITLLRYKAYGTWYDSVGNTIVSFPMTGETMEFEFRVDGDWAVESGFDTSPYVFLNAEISLQASQAVCEFDTSGLATFQTFNGETSYAEVYTYGTNGNSVVVSWIIDTSDTPISNIRPPFICSVPVYFTKGTTNSSDDNVYIEFSATASLPEGPSYEDLVVGGLGDINDTLNQILVDIDSEELAGLIEEKLRQSDVGTVPESPIDQGEIDELESVEDNLFNLADEKKQSFSDALNTWQGAFTSGGGGGKIGVVTGSIFNKILAIPFIRDLVYLSLGFGLITFTLRLGRKLV